MSFANSSKFNLCMRLYVSICIFLFSAFLVCLPNGYSYAPLLLLLGSIVLIITHPRLNLKMYDWLFITSLFFYFMVNVISAAIHSLPLKSYDLPSRYLLAIPVYLLLIAYPANKNCFWSGLIIGAIGAGCIAIYQRYFLGGIWWRVGGFINPIQFGDICILISGLLSCGLLLYFNGNKSNHRFKKYIVFFLFIGIILAVLASLLSWTRGGWLAIPFIVLVFFKASAPSAKRKIFLLFSFFSVFILILFIFLPKSNSVKERVLQSATEIKIYLAGEQAPDSVNIRMKMWSNGIEAFEDKPFIGWGDLSSIKLNYAPDWEAINLQGDFNHLHNSFIDELAKRGVVGFAALIFLLGVPFYYFLGVMRSGHINVVPFGAAGIILILSVIVFGFTQVFTAHNSGVMVFVFYLVIIKAYCRNILNIESGLNEST